MSATAIVVSEYNRNERDEKIEAVMVKKTNRKKVLED